MKSQTTRATNCATPGNRYEILCRSSKHVVWTTFEGILLKGENRVRLVFEGVAALAENIMDGPLRAPKEGIMLALRHKATTKWGIKIQQISERRSNPYNGNGKQVTPIPHAFNTNSTSGNEEKTKNRWNPVVSTVFLVEISGIEPLTSWMPSSLWPQFVPIFKHF